MWKSSNSSDRVPIPGSPMSSEMAGERREGYSDLPRMQPTDVAHIGKSVVIKGELSGSENLFLDGEVEGSIDLREHSLTVGPHGRVRANVQAREIVVHGKVDGRLDGTERVELKRSAVHTGDISTQRIVIEDGAFIKGAIDIRKSDKVQQKPAETPKSFSAAAPSGTTLSSKSGQAGLVPQN